MFWFNFEILPEYTVIVFEPTQGGTITLFHSHHNKAYRQVFRRPILTGLPYLFTHTYGFWPRQSNNIYFIVSIIPKWVLGNCLVNGQRGLNPELWRFTSDESTFTKHLSNDLRLLNCFKRVVYLDDCIEIK